jgi:hypothetical protein
MDINNNYLEISIQILILMQWLKSQLVQKVSFLMSLIWEDPYWISLEVDSWIRNSIHLAEDIWKTKVNQFLNCSVFITLMTIISQCLIAQWICTLIYFWWNITYLILQGHWKDLIYIIRVYKILLISWWNHCQFKLLLK